MEYPVYESSRELSLTIPMEDIAITTIDDILIEKIKDILTSNHNGEGIILPDSISIVSRSPLRLNASDSTFTVIVRYKATVADTPSGSEFNAKVESVISSGLICHVYHERLAAPIIRAYIPISIHTDDDRKRIQSILKNDIIRIKSVNRKGSLADKIITTLGSFIDLVKRPEATEDKPIPVLAPADEGEYDREGDGDPIGPLGVRMEGDAPDEKEGVGAIAASGAGGPAAAAPLSPKEATPPIPPVMEGRPKSRREREEELMRLASAGAAAEA